MKPYSIYIHRKLPVIRVKTSVSQWTDTAEALSYFRLASFDELRDVHAYLTWLRIEINGELLAFPLARDK